MNEHLCARVVAEVYEGAFHDNAEALFANVNRAEWYARWLADSGSYIAVYIEYQGERQRVFSKEEPIGIDAIAGLYADQADGRNARTPVVDKWLTMLGDDAAKHDLTTEQGRIDFRSEVQASTRITRVALLRAVAAALGQPVPGNSSRGETVRVITETIINREVAA